MARILGVLAAVSLVVGGVLGARLLLRVGRDVEDALGALDGMRPTLGAARDADAGLVVDDAAAPSWTPRAATPRRAEAAAPIAAAPTLTLAEALIARTCPTVTRLLTESYARCGCTRPAPDLEASLVEACARWAESRVPDHAAGALELDETRIVACLDRIEVARDACSFDGVTEDCRVLVREPVVLGEPCSGVAGRCREGVCAGTCLPAPGEGEPSVEGECAVGLIVGSDGTCVAPPTEGMPCHDGECRTPLYCDRARCVRPRRLGEPCSSTGDCDDGLRCDESGECRSGPRWCSDGEDCGWGYECDDTWTSRCARCVYCPATRTCEDGVTSCGRGERCVETNHVGRCAPGLCTDGRLAELLAR